jgi:hypothetical protein
MAPFQSTSPGARELQGLLPSLRATGGPRSLMVAAGSIVLGGIAWTGISHYSLNPWLFGSLTVGCTVFVALLLAQGLGVFGMPRQGEPSPLNLFTISNQRMFYATGFQTPQDMENLIRDCLGVTELPPPSALVKGDVRNKANWQELTPTEAAKIAETDRASIGEKLKEIVKAFAGEVVEKNVVWAPQKEIGELGTESAPELKKENRDK